MQRQVLDYLYAQGELVMAVFPGNPVPQEALEKFALAMNAGACFVIFDFTRTMKEKAPLTLADLFARTLTNAELQEIEACKQGGLVFGGFATADSSEESFRRFYHNLESIKKIVPHTICVMPADDPTALDKNILEITKLVMVSSDKEDEAAAFIEDCTELQKKNILWLQTKFPDKKRFPHAAKAIKSGASKDVAARDKLADAPEVLADSVKLILKEGILRKNPMEGLSRLFRNLFPLFLLIALLVPFIYPTSIESSHSNMRDRIPERNKLSVAPSFDYTFDGKENLRRIARYAIGRFNAVISDDKMVRQYIEETVSENGYKGQGWETNALAVRRRMEVLDVDTFGQRRLHHRVLQRKRHRRAQAQRHRPCIETGRANPSPVLGEGLHQQERARRRDDRARARKGRADIHALRPTPVPRWPRSHAGRPDRDCRHDRTHDRPACAHRYWRHRQTRNEPHRQRFVQSNRPYRLVLQVQTEHAISDFRTPTRCFEACSNHLVTDVTKGSKILGDTGHKFGIFLLIFA